MLIKYDFCGDNNIVNIPETMYWKISFAMLDENGRDDYNLYLHIGNEKITIRDTDFWSMGRDLPYEEVGYMYEEMVDIIAAKIEQEPNLKIIDISAIESTLINEKYEKRWIEKGYIEPDADGSW